MKMMWCRNELIFDRVKNYHIYIIQPKHKSHHAVRDEKKKVESDEMYHMEVQIFSIIVGKIGITQMDTHQYANYHCDQLPDSPSKRTVVTHQSPWPSFEL